MPRGEFCTSEASDLRVSMVAQLDHTKDQKPAADVQAQPDNKVDAAKHTDAGDGHTAALQAGQGTAQAADAQREQIAAANKQVDAATAKHLGSVELTTPNGDHVLLQNGKVLEISDKGTLWTSTDGKTFSSGHLTKTLQKDKEGNYDLLAPTEGAAPRHPAPPPEQAAQPAPQKPAEKPLDAKEIEADADAIRKATGNDNWVARWADTDAINKVLEGKTDAERKAIDAEYQVKHGVSLDQEMAKFENGAIYDKFENLLHKNDKNIENQNARRIHEDLLENTNVFEGRSKTEIEKDVRDLISTHNSAQLAKMDQEYRNLYGKSLRDGLISDPTLSPGTKEMVGVYLPDPKLTKGGEQFKGNDKITDADTAKLIDTALKHQDTNMFAEAMRDASATARKNFIDQGGEQRVNNAFDHWYSNKDVEHAMDYARQGKLDAATKVVDNTGVVSTNDKGIELAIKDMTADERSMYAKGKAIESGKPPSDMSDSDQQNAKAYYDKMHAALANAGNATTVTKWEDMIANNGSTSLIGDLAGHHHTFWFNDKTADVSKDIENMSEKDWKDCQQHPERRDQLKQMLESLNKKPAEVDQMLSVYDKKMAAPDYDHARDLGKRSVLDEVNNNDHWYGANRDGVLDAITNMSATDQALYRSDENFRKQLDQKIGSTLQMPSDVDAAHRMLEQVKEGKAPTGDVIANLERIQNFDGSKTTDAVQALQKALKDDPTLHDRVVNPKTDADKKFADAFKEAAQSAFGDDYDQFGKPLIEKGSVPLETKISLDKGLFSNDYNAAFADLQSATPEEKTRLKTDAQYREQVIGFMSEDRQKIAMATLDQKELQPEDQIRAAVLGWGGSADVVSTLKAVKPEDLDQLKQEYVTKYGSSLEGDVYNKLTGDDRSAAERVFAKNLSQEEQANIARDQTENARSGIGASLSDNVWRSGTGAQADDAMEQTNRAISDQAKLEQQIAVGNARLAQMTPEQINELKQKVADQLSHSIDSQNQATDNNIESKKAAAEYATDGAIAAVAIGSMIVTGGCDAPLVLALAAAGAGIKVGGTAALEGNDYDWSAGNVAKDAIIGSVTAATSVIGPGQVAAVFGVGRTAATEAASMAAAEVGEQTLKEGGAQMLAAGTKDIVADALASGAKNWKLKVSRPWPTKQSPLTLSVKPENRQSLPWPPSFAEKCERAYGHRHCQDLHATCPQCRWWRPWWRCRRRCAGLDRMGFKKINWPKSCPRGQLG